MPPFASSSSPMSHSVVSSKMKLVIKDGKCAVRCDCSFQCALPTVHSLLGDVLAGRNCKLCTAALRAPFIRKHLIKMIIYLKPT